MKRLKAITMGSPNIGLREMFSVMRVLRTKKLAQGEMVAKFESMFSSLCDSREVVAVNSGTSALHLGLLSLGIGPGDEVIVPAFTFAASANAVSLAGAEPVFADVDLNTFNIDIDSVKNLITNRTKAIMVVHLFGLPVDMDKIDQLAKEHKLLIIEDAAQAHGATHNSVSVGCLGDVACFSFYPTKNITTIEGGAIVFKERELARHARLLRNQGMEKRYQNEIVGFNLRLNEVQAAIGICQIGKLRKFNRKRKQNADTYLSNLDTQMLRVQKIGPNQNHVFHQFTVAVPNLRDDLQIHLKESGIESAVYYPIAVHKLPSFKEKSSNCPNAESLAKEVLSLPVHPKLSKRDVLRISRTINYFLTGNSKKVFSAQ